MICQIARGASVGGVGVVGKRVVIYGMNYAPEIAGVGRYSGEIGEHLAASGHDVTVVTTPPHYPGWRAQDGHSSRRWTSEIVAGARVYRCPLYLHEDMGGVRRMLAPLSFALASAPVALWQIIRRRPDVVLAVEPTLFVAPIALLGARLIGAKAVLHIQDLEVEAAFAMKHLGGGGPLARLAATFDRAMTRGFDRVITISNRMAEKVVDKGVPAEKVEVIRNWVDMGQIRPDIDASAYRRELGLSASDFVVLYAGNLGAKQGVGLLTEAAKALSGEKRVVFVIAGDGPMRRDLEAAAAELPNMRLLPFQPEARFGEFLRVADLHVLPQERDAADLLLPSKLGGMLASGRRILVTADGGTELATFLGDSCHFTTPGDAVTLASEIVRVANEPACPTMEAERLARAMTLSKERGINKFEATALFLPPPADIESTRREAA